LSASRSACAREFETSCMASATLPEEPTNEGEVREWLLAVRRARFA
jgi:hypothetical protein